MITIATNQVSYKPYGCATFLGMEWRRRMEARRRELGLTQRQLAEQLGISLAHYGHWVHGRREPDLEQFARIAEKLRTTPAWLLYGVESPGDADSSHVLHVMQRMPSYKRALLARMADVIEAENEPGALAGKKAAGGN